MTDEVIAQYFLMTIFSAYVGLFVWVASPKGFWSRISYRIIHRIIGHKVPYYSDLQLIQQIKKNRLFCTKCSRNVTKKDYQRGLRYDFRI